MKRIPFIKIYNSYGNDGRILVIGHVFEVKEGHEKETQEVQNNIVALINLFRKRTISNAKLYLYFGTDVIETTSEFDGFFKFDFLSKEENTTGWQFVRVAMKDDNENIVAESVGQLYLPEKTKYAFVSDIDDTIMQSFSSTIFKRLYELISRSPAKRRLFDNTSKFYYALAESNTDNGFNHPFFYVSSSEWNLYDYLNTVFEQHKLPKGIYLLNTIKYLSSFIKTGKNGHEGKLMRIARIILAFPSHQFVLLGDNSQKDPEIYAAIAEKYPSNIAHVLIRNVNKEKEVISKSFLKNIEHAGTSTCLFNTTQEAISYCRQVGLIHDR